MDRITVAGDSVAGTRCLVVRQNDRPVLTIWEDTFRRNPGATYDEVLRWVKGAEVSDVADLMTTCRALGMGFDQTAEVIQKMLQDKLEGTWEAPADGS